MARGFLQPRRIGFAGGRGDRIDLLQVLERHRALARIGPALRRIEIGQIRLAVRDLGDDLAHGQAPVAEMHVAERAVADEQEQPPQRIADDRRPEMADMHRLGDVGSAIVEDHGLRRLRLDAEPLVFRQAIEVRGEEFIGQREVHEPRPGERHVPQFAGVLRQQSPANSFRDLPGIAFERLRHGERAIGLELPEIGPIGRRDAGVLRGQAFCPERVAHELGQDVGQR